MVRDKAFLRIAKTERGFKYKVDKKRVNKPLDNGYTGSYKKFYPTIVVKMNLSINEELFRSALTELELNIERAENASTVEINQE